MMVRTNAARALGLVLGIAVLITVAHPRLPRGGSQIAIGTAASPSAATPLPATPATGTPASGTPHAVPAECPTTLQQLVDAAAPGDVVLVPPCIYRETVVIRKPLTLDGQGRAELRGSDVWATDWESVGGRWVHSGAPSLSSGGVCREGTDRCAWPHQVFMDGRPLLQVATAPSSGEFSVENGSIILADNPSGHTVEVTTRAAWVQGHADNIVIRGFTMAHAGNAAQFGAIMVAGHKNWTIENNRLSDAHGRIISLFRGSGHQILLNDISRAGQLGIGGSETTNITIQGNAIHDNNTEGFDIHWEAGGLKLVNFSSWIVVEGNETFDNDGVGIWFDVDSQKVSISNNRVHHNTFQGIKFEKSHYGTISGNKVWENGWGVAYGYPGWCGGAGIAANNSDHVEVHGNVVSWNGDGICVTSEDRGISYNNTVENVVHENTIISSGNGSIALGWFCWWGGNLFDGGANNRGANNAYWFADTEGAAHRFAWGTNGWQQHLSDFNQTPGEQDGRYLSAAEKDQLLAPAEIPVAG